MIIRCRYVLLLCKFFVLLKKVFGRLGAICTVSAVLWEILYWVLPAINPVFPQKILDVGTGSRFDNQSDITFLSQFLQQIASGCEIKLEHMNDMYVVYIGQYRIDISSDEHFGNSSSYSCI